MITKVSLFKMKEVFLDYFKKNDFIKNDRVGFRVFDPQKDCIRVNFKREDWDMIFVGVDDGLLREWAASYNVDRMVLVAVDMNSGKSFGFVCVQESHNKPLCVCFHGGVWACGIKGQLLGYEAAVLIVRFLVGKHMDVFVTCYKINRKANRFLDSLGFVDYCRDERLCYKKIEVASLDSNIMCTRKIKN